MNREIENKFFAEYGVDGAALLAIDMVLNEHCHVGSGTASRHDYPDGVLKEIAERTDDFNAWRNSSLLIDEVKSNLIYCNSPENIRLYVKDILFAFSHWTMRYNTWREGLNAIGNTSVYKSLEYYYSGWRIAYNSFAEDLAIALAERGISIFDIQRQCGISIIDNLDIDRCWWRFGTRKRAEECLAKIQPETPLFGRKEAVEIFREMQSLNMGWQDIKGNPCACMRDEDVGAFVCLLLRKETESKITWSARNPQDRNDFYIQPLYEFLRLCGFADKRGCLEAEEAIRKYFDVNVSKETITTYRSRYKHKSRSKQYSKLLGIMCKYKRI